jgi:hypothetical protein
MTETRLPPKTNTLALIGFIAAFMQPIVGIVLGVMAMRQIDVSHEGGRGLARWAVIVGIVGTSLTGIFFIVWLVLFTSAMTQSGIFGP